MGKHALGYFVVVIPEEGLVGMTLTIKLYSASQNLGPLFSYFNIHDDTPKCRKTRIGGGTTAAHQSLFWSENNKDLKMLYLKGPDGLVNRRFENFQNML